MCYYFRTCCLSRLPALWFRVVLCEVRHADQVAGFLKDVIQNVFDFALPLVVYMKMNNAIVSSLMIYITVTRIFFFFWGGEARRSQALARLSFMDNFSSNAAQGHTTGNREENTISRSKYESARSVLIPLCNPWRTGQRTASRYTWLLGKDQTSRRKRGLQYVCACV